MKAAPVELVRVYRSGFHEGPHFGSVVITDADGSVLHDRGDVETPIFPRSSSKPFQAVAMLGMRRRPGRRRPGPGRGLALRRADARRAGAGHARPGRR